MRGLLRRKAALRVVHGAADDRRDVVCAQRLEDHHAAAREQGRIHLERRILGRGPDQADRAVLNRPEERVLLRLVESMNLVDEQDGARLPALVLLGVVNGRANLTHAGEHRGNRDQLRPIALGDQSGERRLPRSGRPPEYERRQLARSP